MPGQRGKTVATFISRSTSAAAGSGTSRSKACRDRPDREELQHPSDGLQEDRRDGGRRRAEHREPLPGHREQPHHRTLAVGGRRPVGATGADDRDGEERKADEPEDHEPGDGPVRHLCRRHDVGDEQGDREQVEQPVGEHRPEQRRARPGPAGQVSPEYGDAGQLARTGREDGVSEEADAERREHLHEPRQRRWERLVDRDVPGKRTGEHREEVEDDAHDDPAPPDEVERVVDGVPLRPAPPEGEERRDERGQDEEPARPWVPRERLQRRHAAAFALGAPDDALVDALEPRGDVRPAVPLARERARRGAHRLAARLVGEQADDRIRERPRIAGGHRDGCLGRHDLAIPLDVGCDDRGRARERTRQDHAEALPAERRRHERLRGAEQVGQLVLAQEADDVDPAVGNADARQEEAHGERVGARDDEPRARSAMDLGPGAEKDVEALSRLVPAGEHDRVLAVGRVCPLGQEHAVRDDLEVAAEPLRRGGAGALGDRDPLVDAIHQEAPGGHAEAHPAEVARRVVRRDDRRPREREDRDADRRGHRLVQVEHVELLALEDAADPEDRAGAEHDVRQRAVRRDDHGPSDGDHVRRRITVPPDPGVERSGELTGRVVPHQQPHIVAPRLERGGLELGVLDHRTPERPRERHDDADLHAGSLTSGGCAHRSVRTTRATSATR